MKVNWASSLRAVHRLSTDVAKTAQAAEPLLVDLFAFRDTDKEISSANHLAYLYIEILIHRALLRPWLAGGKSTNSPTGEDEDIRHTRTNMRRCMKSASDFVRSLSPELSAVFWPPWSQAALSSILQTHMMMAISSLDYDEALSWVQDLMSTRRSARLRVKSFPQLRLGLLRIDSLFWRGIGRVLNLEPHVSDAFISALADETGSGGRHEQAFRRIPDP